jgi:hypothetical protein
LELASDDRRYLSSIGLITRIEQWAALLSAFCLLVGVRAAVLSESDRLYRTCRCGLSVIAG